MKRRVKADTFLGFDLTENDLVSANDFEENLL